MKKVTAVLVFMICIMTCLCGLSGCKGEEPVEEDEYRELPYHYEYLGTVTQEFLCAEENRIRGCVYPNLDYENYDPVIDGYDEYIIYYDYGKDVEYIDPTLPSKERIIFIDNKQQLDGALDTEQHPDEIDFKTQMVVVFILGLCPEISIRPYDIMLENEILTFFFEDITPKDVRSYTHPRVRSTVAVLDKLDVKEARIKFIS